MGARGDIESSLSLAPMNSPLGDSYAYIDWDPPSLDPGWWSARRSLAGAGVGTLTMAEVCATASTKVVGPWVLPHLPGRGHLLDK